MARGRINDGDVIFFGSKPLGNTIADLPCSAYDYTHIIPPT
jgi:hypothetical protein